MGTFYVKPAAEGGNDSNNGSSWELAKATLQAGVDLANASADASSTIYVADGTYSSASLLNFGNTAKNISLIADGGTVTFSNSWGYYCVGGLGNAADKTGTLSFTGFALTGAYSDCVVNNRYGRNHFVFTDCAITNTGTGNGYANTEEGGGIATLTLVNTAITVAASKKAIYVNGSMNPAEGVGISITGTGGAYTVGGGDYGIIAAAGKTINQILIGSGVTVSGAVNGIVSSGAVTTLNNAGTISSASGAAASFVAGVGTINNTGTIASTNNIGISISTAGTGGTINNDGTITGGSDGITMGRSCTAINNRGSIVAPNGYGINITSGTTGAVNLLGTSSISAGGGVSVPAGVTVSALTKEAASSIVVTNAAIYVLGTLTTCTLDGSGDVTTGRMAGINCIAYDDGGSPATAVYGSGTSLTIRNLKMDASGGNTVRVRRKMGSITLTNVYQSKTGATGLALWLGEDIADGNAIAEAQWIGEVTISGGYAVKTGGTGHGNSIAYGVDGGTISDWYSIGGENYGLVIKAWNLSFSNVYVYCECPNGFYLSGAYGCTLDHCTLVCTVGPALLLSSNQIAGSKAHDNTITNCVIACPGNGQIVQDIGGTSSGDNTFDYNLHWKTGTGAWWKIAGSDVATATLAALKTAWDGVTDYETNEDHGLVGDPLFLSTFWGSEDFLRVGRASPAKKAASDGTTIGAYQITGKAVLLGGGLL